jgi:hypothetical protein
MKFNFDIECTPEEARRFLGLPDIAAMQDRMMKDLEDRIAENIKSLDPESLVKTWMPATLQGWTEMQKMFWAQLGIDFSGGAEQGEPAKAKKK